MTKPWKALTKQPWKSQARNNTADHIPCYKTLLSLDQKRPSTVWTAGVYCTCKSFMRYTCLFNKLLLTYFLISFLSQLHASSCQHGKVGCFKERIAYDMFILHYVLTHTSAVYSIIWKQNESKIKNKSLDCK